MTESRSTSLEGRIVVAVDGSEQSHAAAALAFALGTRLTLVHALEAAAPAEDDWRGRLAALAADAPAAASVETLVIHAETPAGGLLELLHARGDALLAVGTHGTGGLKRLLLGSVSQRLLEHAPCSVLLVRDVPDLDGPRTVVAAVDGSAASASVVATAQAAATALSARLVIVHVADGGVNPALHEYAQERGRQVLAQAEAELGEPVETELLAGSPREELVAFCEQRGPVLAVVSSTGMHGFKNLLVGSTTQHLVNHAPCPVLVVRAAAAG